MKRYKTIWTDADGRLVYFLFPLRLQGDPAAELREQLLTVKRELTALPPRSELCRPAVPDADPHIRQALQPPRPQKVSFNY